MSTQPLPIYEICRAEFVRRKINSEVIDSAFNALDHHAEAADLGPFPAKSGLDAG